jgi:hypothetical protein
MKHVTWPAAVVVVAVLAALTVLFGLEQDQALRQTMLGYFDTVGAFVLGLAAGAGAGAAAGYASGYLRGHSARAVVPPAEPQRVAESTPAPAPDAVRRAAEVVRVAADESDRAADEARAAATALRVAAEEGRAVAELQRSLLAEIRRTGGGQDGSWPAARVGGPNISVQR